MFKMLLGGKSRKKKINGKTTVSIHAYSEPTHRFPDTSH